MMYTYASIFSGGELAGEGAKAAGFVELWGIEIDDRIASVARLNGHKTITADVLDIDPHTLERPFLFHASPVCKNASNAKSKGVETALDIAYGEKTAEFIRVLQPECFTLENVFAYRHFEAFQRIRKALDELGYWYEVKHLNSADFGVPQSRRRLILRARRNRFLSPLPKPVRHVGWYEAVEDLVDTFENSAFAPWQLERFPEDLRNNILVGQQKYKDVLGVAGEETPVMTITASSNQKHLRAFLVSAGPGDGSLTVLVDGQTNEGHRVTQRSGNETSFTVTSSETKRPARALVQGRVVKISPRGLARFQSVPDSYILPENTSLACQIIGNGVPCLMYQRIAESFWK